MIGGRRPMQLAALWHWYLPLCIYLTFSNFYCFCPFLFPPVICIDKLDGLVDDTMVACPSLICIYNKDELFQNFECDVCVCMFYVRVRIGFVD